MFSNTDIVDLVYRNENEEEPSTSTEQMVHKMMHSEELNALEKVLT